MMPWVRRHTAGWGRTMQVEGPCTVEYPANGGASGLAGVGGRTAGAWATKNCQKQRQHGTRLVASAAASSQPACHATHPGRQGRWPGCHAWCWHTRGWPQAWGRRGGAAGGRGGCKISGRPGLQQFGSTSDRSLGSLAAVQATGGESPLLPLKTGPSCDPPSSRNAMVWGVYKARVCGSIVQAPPEETERPMAPQTS